jgi:membrane fusion protein
MSMALTTHDTGAAENSSMPSSLFRQEVFDFQRAERQFGRVLQLQPISIVITTWTLAVSVALILGFLVFGEYARKVTVIGYLLPSSGTAKIFALQRGTITQVHVKEGQQVERDQPVITIDTSQISASGEDVNAAILSTLTSQKEQLDHQMEAENGRMASEKERLSHLIEGLNEEISALEAQLPLQQQRIEIAQAMVQSISQLVAKGTVTDVEYKRRQSEALEQKQNLSVLKQQLAARQNQLIDTKYSLEQLPIATAEKVQLLRNELSNVEQRIKEIEGRRAFVIRAPVAGRVTSIVASVGKIADPSELQLEIVPENSMLEAEVFVPSRSIGFVRVGERVSVRYDAFPYQHFGRYQGTVAEISQNILTGAELSSSPVPLQEPVYRVTVALERQDVDAYGNKVPLQPGMLLKSDIILDQRSLMRWILDPLLAVRG